MDNTARIIDSERLLLVVHTAWFLNPDSVLDQSSVKSSQYFVALFLNFGGYVGINENGK